VLILFPVVARNLAFWMLFAIIFSSVPVLMLIFAIVCNLCSFAKRNRALILTPLALSGVKEQKTFSSRGSVCLMCFCGQTMF
jgi:hypothetical protein